MSELALQLIAKEKEEKTGILDLGKCGLTELPEELFELTWLTELNVCNVYYDFILKERVESKNNGTENNLLIIPPSIKKLTLLTTLRIGGNDFFNKWTIQNISVLQHLHQLQSLDLSFNQISDISFLQHLHQLQSLY
ncbi:MAG: leucine-rich repeat domain-containing protein, partial [Bacteroidota bacterium]